MFRGTFGFARGIFLYFVVVLDLLALFFWRSVICISWYFVLCGIVFCGICDVWCFAFCGITNHILRSVVFYGAVVLCVLRYFVHFGVFRP